MTATAKQIANLKPLNTLNEADAKRIRSKGGKRASEVRRERRSFREEFLTLLSKPLNKGRATDINDLTEITEETIAQANLTPQQIITYRIMRNAMNGDIRSAQFVMSAIGEVGKEEKEAEIFSLDLEPIEVQSNGLPPIGKIEEAYIEIIAKNPQLYRYFEHLIKDRKLLDDDKV